MNANFVYGKPIMSKYTPAVAYSAGDVLVIGATPFVAHMDNPTFGTAVTLDALACGGGVYQMPTDGTPVVGEDVFYDATAKKLTATSTGNTHFGLMLAGPTGDMGKAGPAADGDLGFALHDPIGNASTSISKKSEATQSTTATLTAAQLLGGFINSVPAGAVTLTLPTAANLVAGVTGAKVGDAFECAIENTSGGANAITLAAGGATLRGGTSIAQNKAALLRFVLTNVTLGTEAYTAYSIIGA
jgi:hypothetical protein